ncbi:hypothetical protein HGRIS_002003 [Hohenbuehelia grisea]|uniref:YjgF-like protein n=1 Tax=Hohenbuehelia grisea TaxID=104357 RepID=A0ABR3JJ40_9AGAR
MENVQRFNTANPYESKFGYSRAIRRGPFIFVSGTTSIDASTGTVLHPDSASDQTRKIFQTIIEAIEGLGGKKGDVVRLRLFVKHDEDADGVGLVMREVFGSIAPTATMILGARFVSPQMKVEIEADAIVSHLST